MWHSVKRADIERAKQQLDHSRAETLRRQAAEIAGLEAEQGELETLGRLAERFAGKHTTLAPPPRPSEPIVTKVAVPRTLPRHPPAPRRDRREYPRTNFEAFARAVARTGP